MYGAAPTNDQGVMPSPMSGGTPFAVLTEVVSSEFVAPRDGTFTVYGWGPGGGGGYFGGRCGGKGKKKVRLSKGQKLGISFGTAGAGRNAASFNFGVPGGDTIISFPDGSTMTCKGGGSENEAIGGSAIGADESFVGGGGPSAVGYPSLPSSSIGEAGVSNAAFPDLPGTVGIGGLGGVINEATGGGIPGLTGISFGAGGGGGARRGDNAAFTNGGTGAPGACIIREEGIRNV